MIAAATWATSAESSTSKATALTGTNGRPGLAAIEGLLVGGQDDVGGRDGVELGAPQQADDRELDAGRLQRDGVADLDAAPIDSCLTRSGGKPAIGQATRCAGSVRLEAEHLERPRRCRPGRRGS